MQLVMNAQMIVDTAAGVHLKASASAAKALAHPSLQRQSSSSSSASSTQQHNDALAPITARNRIARQSSTDSLKTSRLGDLDSQLPPPAASLHRADDSEPTSYIVRPKNAGIPLRVSSPMHLVLSSTQAEQQRKSSLAQGSQVLPLASVRSTSSSLDGDDSIWQPTQHVALMSPATNRSPSGYPFTPSSSVFEAPSIGSTIMPHASVASINATHLLRSPTLTDRLAQQRSQSGALPPISTLFSPTASTFLLSPSKSTVFSPSEGYVGAGRTTAKPASLMSPITTSDATRPPRKHRKDVDVPAFVWKSTAAAVVGSAGANVTPRTSARRAKHNAQQDFRQFYKETQAAIEKAHRK